MRFNPVKIIGLMESLPGRRIPRRDMLLMGIVTAGGFSACDLPFQKQDKNKKEAAESLEVIIRRIQEREKKLISPAVDWQPLAVDHVTDVAKFFFADWINSKSFIQNIQ